MVNGWPTEEAVEFCTYYLDLNRIGVPVSRHEGRLGGRGTIGEQSVRIDDLTTFKQAHFAILQQAYVVSPYIDMHKRELQGKYRASQKHGSQNNTERNLEAGYDLNWQVLIPATPN